MFNGNGGYNDALIFTVEDGSAYKMEHCQSCCEKVYIESIVVDLQDLVGSPILVAEEVNGKSPADFESYHDSYTWTFYKFATIKGMWNPVAWGV